MTHRTRRTARRGAVACIAAGIMVLATVAVAGCGGDGEAASGATMPTDPDAPELVVTAYFDAYAAGDVSRAASLVSDELVLQCGGREALEDAIARARQVDPIGYPIASAVFRQGTPPAVAVEFDGATSQEPGSVPLAIGVSDAGGTWRLAEHHPAPVSAYCGSLPG